MTPPRQTLVAGRIDEGQRRFFPGEAIELYVDPNDMTQTVEVDAIEENVTLGVIGIGIAALFAVAWPVYEAKRPIKPSAAHPRI